MKYNREVEKYKRTIEMMEYDKNRIEKKTDVLKEEVQEFKSHLHSLQQRVENMRLLFIFSGLIIGINIIIIILLFYTISYEERT
jgi:predicted nuclease with TOPRIM domain